MKNVEYTDPPSLCDICGGEFNGVLYDAKTSWGPWATMCGSCFRVEGGSLGLGRGQKYVKQVVKYVGEAGLAEARVRWVKTQG